MDTPQPAGMPDPATHPHPPPEDEKTEKDESASDADAGDVTPPQADATYDEPGDNPLASEDDDD
jgi:hypothetical protein